MLSRMEEEVSVDTMCGCRQSSVGTETMYLTIPGLELLSSLFPHHQVYFARDAWYSGQPIYSVPDSSGVQCMFLSRVLVGDWCLGTKRHLTPDPKPHNNLELFDSTVDNIRNPSIFVIYHDAQAYPEYLVSFQFSSSVDC
jgi:Poly(ADP-ribose) polymerase catalytic domain